MQILDTALQREVEAERYYRELAGKAPEGGMRTILNRLADAEERHQYVVKSMKEAQLDCDAGDEDFLADVKAQCKALHDAAADFSFDRSQIELYKHARDRESDSKALYLKAANAAEDARAVALLRRLADQEDMHYQILDGIITFVSRPEAGQWLEDA